MLLSSQLSSATSPFYFATAFTCKFTIWYFSLKSPCSSKQRHIVLCIVLSVSPCFSTIIHWLIPQQHMFLLDPTLQAVHQAACRDKKEMNPVATRGITNSMGMKKPAKGMKRRKPGRPQAYPQHHISTNLYDISSSKPPFSSGISQPRLLTRDPFVKKTRVDWWILSTKICINSNLLKLRMLPSFPKYHLVI